MNINRHNYEEYFILYLDNELSDEERLMVEDFVQQQPDLKEELAMLLHYKLEPDTSVTFQNKEDLMKHNGETPVTHSNYQEWLLLYTYNELSVQQKEMVEDFAVSHPEVKEELALLLKTRLQPETVLFNNKELLYRQETKVRPLFGRWYRIAAAVLVLALGLTTLIIVNNNREQKASVAVQNPKQTQDSNSASQNPGTQEPVAAVNEIADSNSNTRENTNNEKSVLNPVYKQAAPDQSTYAVTANNALPKQNIQPKPVESKNEQVLADINNKKKDNNLPKPAYNPNVIKEENNIIAKTDAPKINDNNILTGTPVTETTVQPSDFVQASYPAEDNNGKKNKLRGFLRKVTRTFEKRTNIDPTNDDGKIYVANFSIRTK
ncbi:MAG: hypothetical protein IPH18_09470 [Chitinophagaceae bacterium]|nr:hypothetical protein [Chitinophagaceae bacterium]